MNVSAASRTPLRLLGAAIRMKTRVLGGCSSFRIGAAWKSRREPVRRYLFEGERKALRPGS